jgi:hypothetical protein
MVVAMKREGQNGGSVGGGSSKFFDHARVYAFTDASTQTLSTFRVLAAYFGVTGHGPSFLYRRERKQSGSLSHRLL